MFNGYTHTSSLSSSLDFLTDICDLIESDRFSVPSTNGIYQSEELSRSSNDISPNQSSENLTSTSPDSNGSSTENIPFDQTEWLIRDPSTNRIRPPKLFEFLQLLLNNLRYMSYATWLNKNEGLFQIHKPHEVAELWNQVKIRHTINTITFKNLSRSIRCYYPTGQMIATHKKYTYRFGIQK